jgi:phospholipid/cholesterol/gamma-HCH transport system substrate-binding protein
VEVNLKIDKKVGIRKDASYVIGSSGLLGDKFVEVRPKEYAEGEAKADYVADGDVIEGVQTSDIDTLMNSAQPLIERANHIAAQLDDMITRLNTDVLSGTSTDDLKATIAQLREMVNNGDGMMKNANAILGQAKDSKGAFGRLINDKETGDNLAAFIKNLKEHGPVFYKDESAEKADKDGKKK